MALVALVARGDRPRGSAHAVRHLQVPCQSSKNDETGMARTKRAETAPGWSNSPQWVERFAPVGGAIHSTHHARWWGCRGASCPRSRPDLSRWLEPALKPLFSRAVRTVAWNAVRGFGREASKPRERPTGTRSAQTPEKRRRSGRGAFRETRSGRSGRSSRGLTSRSSAGRPVRRCH